MLSQSLSIKIVFLHFVHIKQRLGMISCRVADSISGKECDGMRMREERVDDESRPSLLQRPDLKPVFPLLISL